MKRLTTKTSIMGRKHDLAYGYASIWKEKLSKHYRYDLIEEAVDKLGAIENLEESIGIDLITLFKALRNGIYTRDYGYLLVEHFVLKSEHELHCRPTYRKELRFTLKDYGKTWTLRKEDLQDDK